MKVLNEFVDSNKCPCPSDSGAAVDQDGLGVFLSVADGADGLHHVQHDPGVFGGREVSPLLGLQMRDLANLRPILHEFDDPDHVIECIRRN